MQSMDAQPAPPAHQTLIVPLTPERDTKRLADALGPC